MQNERVRAQRVLAAHQEQPELLRAPPENAPGRGHPNLH